MDKRPVLVSPSSSEEKLPIGCLRWRPKGSSKEKILVSAGVDGAINYWNTMTEKIVGSIKPEKKYSDLLCLDYSRDGAHLAAAGRRRSIKVYDDEKRSLLCKLRHKGQLLIPGHSNRIFAVKFDETGRNLISGSWDRTIKVWDLHTGTVVRSIFGPEVSGDSIDVHEDLLLAGSHRSKNSLQVWSLSYGTVVEEIEWDMAKPGDSSLIFSAMFDKGSGCNCIAACGSGRNEARIFEKKEDGKFGFSCGIVDLPSSCSSIDVSFKDKKIAIGCCDGICRLLEKTDKAKKEPFLINEGAAAEGFSGPMKSPN